jgi:hypothetical protein
MALSSINTGLQNIPDLTDIQSVGKLSFQFIQIYNAIGVLQQAIDSYTGNTPSGTVGTGGSPESTVIVGNMASMYATANVNIPAGYLVSINGSGQVVLANAAYAANVPAMGLSIAAASAGAQCHILLFGLFNFGGSVTPGTIYYTSPNVAGGLAATKPVLAGQLIQPVAFGVDTNSVFLNPSLYTTQA